MKQKDKLKTMTMVSKFFALFTFLASWYVQASEDEVIDTPELIELGAGVCGILGFKTAINLSVPPQDD